MSARVTIYQTFNAFEANLIKSLFDSENVFCFLKTNDASGTLPHLGFSQGGIDIVIDRQDVEIAKDLLENLN